MKIQKAIMILFCLIFALTCFLPLSVLATSETSQETTNGVFSDVTEKHYAYNQIEWAYKRGIISGNGDGTFSPDRAVTRAEFAKMMVLTLEMQLIEPEKATFEDVKDGSSQFKYVETAKSYMTVYKTKNGTYYYHPADSARREDMAVALVKALGMYDKAADLSVLSNYSDKESISPNLRKYVAIAIKNKIMVGMKNTMGQMQFSPQETLTRAHAAVLLYNAFINDDEKTVLNEEEKDTFDNSDDDTVPIEDNGLYSVPVVWNEASDSKIILRWKPVSSKNFVYYKVVISKTNSKPTYPEDGYYEVISDIKKTYSYVYGGKSYSGGDIGGRLKAGETYYFSVTAVYKDKKVPGNAIRLKVPGVAEENVSTGYAAPVVKAEISDGKVLMNWSRASDNNFTYYKVVVSKYDSHPVYPEQGYKEYYTDINKRSCTLADGDCYNNGDFGDKLESGGYYYFSVTAVYEDGSKKVAGNAVKLKMP